MPSNDLIDVGNASEYRFSRTRYYFILCNIFIILSVISTTIIILVVEKPQEPYGGIFDYSLTDINGKVIHLSKYHHKVIIIVNVASQCGLTYSQYSGLNDLHKRYSDNGLIIIGFPSNEFGEQEPGSNEQIKEFTQSLGVEFILAQKTNVNGINQHPIYEYIHSKYPNDILWNFEKFLLDKNGNVFSHFESSFQPQNMAVDIVKLLYTA